MDEHTYLIHHGIKGQKWGIRRYQNPDGTLTSEGKKRYYNSDGSFTTDKKLRREFSKLMRDELRVRRSNAAMNAQIKADMYAKESALKGQFDNRKYNEVYGKAYMNSYDKVLKNVYGKDAAEYLKKEETKRAKRLIAAILVSETAAMAGSIYLLKKSFD